MTNIEVIMSELAMDLAAMHGISIADSVVFKANYRGREINCSIGVLASGSHDDFLIDYLTNNHNFRFNMSKENDPFGSYHFLNKEAFEEIIDIESISARLKMKMIVDILQE
jgi:hypothetical protein